MAWRWKKRSPSMPSGARMTEHGRPSDVLDHPRTDGFEVAGEIELGERGLFAGGPQRLVRVGDGDAGDRIARGRAAQARPPCRQRRACGAGGGPALAFRLLRLVGMPDRIGLRHAPARQHERLRARPLPAAICSMVRPEATERSFVRMASPSPGLAHSSRCLISSQLLRLPPSRSCFMRTSTQPPCSLSPASTNFSSPLRSASVDVLVALGQPEAAIPQHDGAAAILALGDRALEVAVVERMVLDLDGEALVVRIERRALGHRPAT